MTYDDWVCGSCDGGNDHPHSCEHCGELRYVSELKKEELNYLRSMFGPDTPA